MGYFNNICLVKAPQAFELPHPQDVSDLTEICYLAAVVEKEVESVSIPVDFFNEDGFEDFTKFLKRNPVDLVGISSMTGAFNNAIRLAKIAKRFDKYVVMGGYHSAALPKDVLKSPYVDAVILGEGEATLKDFVLNGPSKKVSGLVFKENGGTVSTGCRPLIKDLDTLPHPLRSIRPVRFGEKGDEYSIDTIYTSRGCPWTCTFCANDTINKQWRARSPENVVEELERLHHPKRKKLIKIWDANFLTNIKRVEKLCDLMMERKLTNFKLWTETRVDDILRGEGIMEKLHQVGLHSVSLGIESPNADTLKRMNKKNKGDACAKAVDILKRYGIKSQGYFIIGHYAETIEDTKRYPVFAEALGLHQSIFMVMTPYPGTVVYKEFKEEKKIKSYDWDNYNNFCSVVETKGMDINTLKKMYAYCWGKFYNKYSFLKEEKFLNMAVPPMLRLVCLSVIFKIQKDNTRDDIKDYLFYSLDAGSENLSRQHNIKSPWILRFFTNFIIRIRHSPGKNVDFFITQGKETRKIIAKKTSDMHWVKGITIDLDKVVRLGEKISENRLVSISCKCEILKNLKNYPLKRIKYLLSILSDPKALSMVYNGLLFIVPTLTKGIAAIFIGAIPLFQKTKEPTQSHHI